MKNSFFAIWFLSASLGFLSARAAAPEKVADGIVVPLGDRFLKVQVCSDGIIRVVEGKDRAFFTHRSLSVTWKPGSKADWKLKSTATEATITTAKLAVRVDLGGR